MPLLIIFFVLLFFQPIYADISKLPVFPSGVKVTFEAPELVVEEVKEVEKEKPKKRRWGRKKKEKKVEKVEEVITNIPPKMQKFTQFIRLINSTKLTNTTNSVALVFYDKEDKMIGQTIVTNSPKVSANYIFFIDRNTGRSFKGKSDIYHIPKEATYFKVGILNKEMELITVAEHPNFNENNKIQIENYKKISPRQSTMLQIELLGNEENILTRAGAFYFVR